MSQIKSILIATQNKVEAEKLSNLIDSIGYEQVQRVFAHDGNDLLNKISNQKFDLVFTHYELPKKNGIDTLKIINERNEGLKVIILMKELVKYKCLLAKNYGAYSIIPLRIEDSELKKKIKNLIDLQPWTSEIMTGIPDIDQEHSELFSMLLDIVVLDFKSKSDLFRILNRLDQHCFTHFKEEEDEMKRFGYPKLEAHKKQHRAMTANLKTLRLSIEASSDDINTCKDKVYKLLVAWFKKHLLESDLDFIDFYKKHKSFSRIQASASQL